jgi:hypothetical protein
MTNNSLRDGTVGETGLPLYNHVASWQDRGLKSFSFYELMEYFDSREFVTCLRDVHAFELYLKRCVEELDRWEEKITSAEKQDLEKLLKKLDTSFPVAEFPWTRHQSVEAYAFGSTDCSYHELYMRIFILRDAMEMELHHKKLVRVPRFKEEHCDRKMAFGEQVCMAFPSTERDTVEAGNCYAVGLETSCVFHLMRVVDRGVHLLAEDLGMALTNEPWGRILEGIEKELAEIQKHKSDPRWEYRDFYAQRVIELRLIKEAWRDPATHRSVFYSAHEAETVMEYVQRFMMGLSLRLKEQI